MSRKRSAVRLKTFNRANWTRALTTAYEATPRGDNPENIERDIVNQTHIEFGSIKEQCDAQEQAVVTQAVQKRPNVQGCLIGDPIIVWNEKTRVRVVTCKVTITVEAPLE